MRPSPLPLRIASMSVVEEYNDHYGADGNMSNQHYTSANTAALFGGPLSRLHRVRDHATFSNPQDVFRSAFGGYDALGLCALQDGGGGGSGSPRLLPRASQKQQHHLDCHYRAAQAPSSC